VQSFVEVGREFLIVLQGGTSGQDEIEARMVMEY
jgi:hypothetical protein